MVQVQHDRGSLPEQPTGSLAILVDGQRRILNATPQANVFLEQGDMLTRSFGRLGARCQRDIARIDGALDEVRRAGWSSFTLGGKLEAEILPMPESDRVPRFLIIARKSDDKQGEKVATAARIFGLTNAERRLLSILFEGSSLADAAHSLGVARTTARTHLQRVFDKTGSRRQADLLRTVALADYAAVPI